MSDTIKPCPKCCTTRPISEFYKNRRNKDGLQHICKKCFDVYNQNWYSKNRDKKIRADRRLNLKKLYGLTEEEYIERLNIQEGKCAICRTPYPPGYISLCVDHDHQTGKIRGILCHTCNLAVGNIGDNIEIARSLVEYLVRWSVQ